MKKVLMAVAVAVMMLVGSAFAGYDEGMQLYRDRKYVEAEAELRKALPELKGEEAANAQYHIGHSLRFQGKRVEAQAEFAKVLTLENASGGQKADAQYCIAYSLRAQGKHVEAQAEFAKVLTLENASGGQKANAQYYIGHSLRSQGNKVEAESAFKEVLKIRDAGGVVGSALNYITDISDMGDAFILQLSTQPKTEMKDGKEEMSVMRKALLKKAQENSAVCRAIVKSIPSDLVVLAELKPFLNLHQISVKEQAEIHKAIWMANLPRVVEDEQARAVVDGAVTALTQLLGLSENPSIAEVDKKIAEMK